MTGQSRQTATKISIPMFDSTRSYVAQIERYKQHQGKPSERKPRKKLEQYTCLVRFAANPSNPLAPKPERVMPLIARSSGDRLIPKQNDGQG